MNKLIEKYKYLRRFFSFYWEAKTVYKIHSPFVYDLAQAILEDDRQYYIFGGAKRLRQLLLHEQKKIKVADMGAGSKATNTQLRKVSTIARNANKGSAFGELLFRLVDHFKPKVMLELGTSLGLSAMYQAAASLNGQLTTFEGCLETAAVAQSNLERMDFTNVEIVVGNFDETLPQFLQNNQQPIEYAFIDGNHRYEPTLRYFEQLLPHLQEDSVLVFDDIHWSEEMEHAWADLQKHALVTLTIDLFTCGLVFFRKESKVKEHFKLLPSRYKPLQAGFFN